MPLARRHQIEILVSIGAVTLLVLLVPLGTRFGVWTQAVALVCGLLLLAQPPALVGLLEHFRSVSKRVRWTVLGCTAAGLVAHMVWPWPRPAALVAVTAGYFTVVQGAAARAVFEEARRRAGVMGRRLRLIGSGAALAVLLVVVEAVGWIFGLRPSLLITGLLSLGVVAAYWLGLAPPRRLIRTWQEAEIIGFLCRTAERAPLDRADHMAAELNRATLRSVTTASATAVLVSDEDIVVEASSEPAWEAQRLVPDTGLVGIALGGVDPVVGPPDECERPLRALADGDVMAVVPIARTSRRWGAVVIVERRESLFLSDDLPIVAALCRHAADAFDHARLIQEEQQQPSYPTDLRVSV